MNEPYYKSPTMTNKSEMKLRDMILSSVPGQITVLPADCTVLLMSNRDTQSVLVSLITSVQ